MEKSDKLEVVGGARREICIYEVVEVGEQILADTRIRFPSISLDSKDYEKGKKSDARRSCWSGRGLVVEVDVIGRRRVFWERKKGRVTKCRNESRAAEWESKIEASKALKWVPKGIKQDVVKPNMGLGTSPVLTNTSVGLLNPIYSGPSLFEVGESSLAGEGGSTQISLTVELETEYRPGAQCLCWRPMLFSTSVPAPMSPRCHQVWPMVLSSSVLAPTSSCCHRVRPMALSTPEPAPMSSRCLRIRPMTHSPRELALLSLHYYRVRPTIPSPSELVPMSSRCHRVSQIRCFRGHRLSVSYLIFF